MACGPVPTWQKIPRWRQQAFKRPLPVSLRCLAWPPQPSPHDEAHRFPDRRSPRLSAALAQTEEGAAAARSLDLSVPQAPIQYRADPTYSNDPPGTFYGDKSGSVPRAPDGRIADVVDDKLQVHGAVAAGVGYSSRGGNSNWQAATINLSKNYTTDEGKTNTFGLNITVGQGERSRILRARLLRTGVLRPGALSDERTDARRLVRSAHEAFTPGRHGFTRLMSACCGHHDSPGDRDEQQPRPAARQPAPREAGQPATATAQRTEDPPTTEPL